MFRVKLMHKDNPNIAICKIYYVLFFLRPPTAPLQHPRIDPTTPRQMEPINTLFADFFSIFTEFYAHEREIITYLSNMRLF